MTGTAPTGKKTVLVVKKDPWIRFLMADLLRGEGYGVVEAPDGNRSLELATQYSPDVILLDVAMPRITDVLHELQTSNPTRGIPVIAVGAYTMLIVGNAARRADEAIQKLFDLAGALTRAQRAGSDGPEGAACGAKLPRRPIIPSAHAEAVPPEPWVSDDASDDNAA
jgi:CheY-like chemotaxis protein